MGNRGRWSVAIVIAVALAVTAPPRAYAQPQSADQLNDAGKQLYQQGDLRGAVERFRGAIAISPEGRYYYNLCVALEKLHQLDEARAACAAITPHNGSAQLNDRAKAKLRALDQAIEARRAAAAATERPRPPAGPAQPRPQVTGPPRRPGEPVPVAPPVVAGSSRPPPPAQVEDVAEPPTEPAKLRVGVKLGLNFAEVHGAVEDGDEQSSDVVPGFAIGGTVAWRLARLFSVRAELGYTTKGGSFEDVPDDQGGEIDLQYDYSYIELAALGAIAVPIRRANLHALGGLALGVLASADVSGGGVSVDISDETESVEVALALGGGVTFPVGRRALTFDLLYQHGLSDIEDPDDDLTITHRVVSLRTAFEF
jgi:hypothetical protein